ncbi:MAG: hypothetical protein VB119_04615 [Candidatus Metalachnospira sp.]|nr:hypothetical protein [Candidatus Metalachnospira sp.]
MDNIFIGFILIFLDFNITIANVRIDIIPDFVGYIVMIYGLVEMSNKSSRFMEAKPYAIGMAVYTCILFFIDIFSSSTSLGVSTYIFAFTSTCISIFISYKIVMGVIDMEEKYNVNLNGNTLKSRWTAFAVINILSFVSLLIPPFSIIFLIVGVIIFICFLFALYNSKKLYYNTTIG